MKFDHIADAVQAETLGLHAESTRDADAGTGFIRAVMGFFVEDSAFGGEAVFGPFMVEMNEGTLPLTEEQMLQSGDGQTVAEGLQS
jgi:hypothetical protein